MNAEFNWWLLIVGLVAGAGLVWLVLSDWSRTDEDLAAQDREAEATEIADAMWNRGEDVDVESVAEVLRLHRAWLKSTAQAPDERPATDDESLGASLAGDAVDAPTSSPEVDGPGTEPDPWDATGHPDPATPLPTDALGPSARSQPEPRAGRPSLRDPGRPAARQSGDPAGGTEGDGER